MGIIQSAEGIPTTLCIMGKGSDSHLEFGLGLVLSGLVALVSRGNGGVDASVVGQVGEGEDGFDLGGVNDVGVRGSNFGLADRLARPAGAGLDPVAGVGRSVMGYPLSVGEAFGPLTAGGVELADSIEVAGEEADGEGALGSDDDVSAVLDVDVAVPVGLKFGSQLDVGAGSVMGQTAVAAARRRDGEQVLRRGWLGV